MVYIALKHEDEALRAECNIIVQLEDVHKKQ